MHNCSVIINGFYTKLVGINLKIYKAMFGCFKLTVSNYVFTAGIDARENMLKESYLKFLLMFTNAN